MWRRRKAAGSGSQQLKAKMAQPSAAISGVWRRWRRFAAATGGRSCGSKAAHRVARKRKASAESGSGNGESSAGSARHRGVASGGAGWQRRRIAMAGPAQPGETAHLAAAGGGGGIGGGGGGAKHGGMRRWRLALAALAKIRKPMAASSWQRSVGNASTENSSSAGYVAAALLSVAISESWRALAKTRRRIKRQRSQPGEAWRKRAVAACIGGAGWRQAKARGEPGWPASVAAKTRKKRYKAWLRRKQWQLCIMAANIGWRRRRRFSLAAWQPSASASEENIKQLASWRNGGYEIMAVAAYRQRRKR